MGDRDLLTQRKPYARMYPEYRLFALILIIIAGYAFWLDSPAEVWSGLATIITSRSILLSDYMLVGGAGAMLLNAALVGGFALLLVYSIGAKPNGAIIMALWMTVGYGFFGKNIFNMIPLTAGVWLYARWQKEPLLTYSLAALLVATLSPVVSEIAFGFSYSHPLIGVILGSLLGLIVGFFFPMISAFTIRVHDGYNLYNMGLAGGLVATLIIAIFKSAGITLFTVSFWGTGYDQQMALLLYALSIILILCGFWQGKGKPHMQNLKHIWRSSGRLVSDYYVLYGESSYINMGILGIVSTTITLLLGISLNGPIMGGILSLIAFGCFGKHPRNVLPIMIGAILATYINVFDPTAPSNAIAILYGTGLAPIAGQFGWLSGIIAGAVHVTLIHHTSYMSGGLNLYNNGFAAGFVAVILVPIFAALKKNSVDK